MQNILENRVSRIEISISGGGVTNPLYHVAPINLTMLSLYLPVVSLSRVRSDGSHGSLSAATSIRSQSLRTNPLIGFVTMFTPRAIQ
jgi:hypothetical protein